MQTELSRSQYVRWRTAVFAIFLISGMSIATWAARVPDIKAALGIENTQVGLLLLGMGIASIIGVSSSPVVLTRLGARRGMLMLLLAITVGIALIGVGTLLASLPVVIAGLVVFGCGNGCLDGIMNVEAAAIEQMGGRTLMPLFHAFFSFGTVIGAGIGWLATTNDVAVTPHTLVVAGLLLVTTIASIANVPARAETFDPQPDDTEKPHWRDRMLTALSAWREPRTYVLGIVMLGMAFAEGGANDWLALGVAEDHGFGSGNGAAALTVFSVAMTVVRVLGGPLVDRFGRVAVLRVLAVSAAGGLVLFILAPNLPTVFIASALWGVGASLGFPLGMSAAADDPAKAAARVSAAATIGYAAFLCGPPILGVISEHVGLLNTLFILVVLIVASGFASGAARPLREDEKTRSS